MGRLQSYRVDRADEGGGGDHQRELAEELSREAGQERCGDEHRHQHQGDANDRPGQFVHRSGGRLAARLTLLDIARHAFDDDDRVIDDDADDEHDGEQRREIDREAERRHGGEGADDRHRHGRRRHQHRPPVLQEDENDDQNEDARLDQGAPDLSDRGFDEFRRVVGDDVFEPLGEAFLELLHFVVDLGGDGDRIGLGQEGDGDAGRRPAVEIERFAVGLGPELHAADVTDPCDLTARARFDFDDEILEIGRLAKAAIEIQRILEILPLHGWRRADLAGGDLLALLLDDADDVLRDEAARLHEVGIQPDAHRVLPGAEHRDVADAVKALKLILDVDDGVVREEERVEATVRRAQCDEFEN